MVALVTFFGFIYIGYCKLPINTSIYNIIGVDCRSVGNDKYEITILDRTHINYEVYV